MKRLAFLLAALVATVSYGATRGAAAPQLTQATLPTTTTTAPAPEPVAVLGDSLVDVSASALTSTLSAHYSPAVEGHSGYVTRAFADLATALASYQPHAVAIVAGANDTYSTKWDARAAVADVGNLVGTFAPTTCVVWVNLNEQARTVIPGVNASANAKRFNEALDYWANEYPNLHVVDWNAALDFAGRDNVLLHENTHPNDLGQVLLASLIDTAFQAC